jgi:hypothetical protein
MNTKKLAMDHCHCGVFSKLQYTIQDSISSL